MPEPATLDLAAIRARAEAATPGPWRRDDDQPFNGVGTNTDGSYTPVDHEGCRVWPWFEAADMAFAYGARTVPALLAEVERLRGDLEIAHGVIHTYQVEHDGKPDDGTARRVIEHLLDEQRNYWVDL